MGQDFLSLRNSCLNSKNLFKDAEFQPSEKILKLDKRRTGIQWLRPGEIRREPKFVLEGFSRFDVHQGGLGDCWLVAAIANLTQNQKMFAKVVPADNSEFEESYAGIFHFRFWKCGKWEDVIIDDRLPVLNGELLFMKAPKCEFWAPLLEKAYAKFYGSYGALEGGWNSEAMVDFTGGVIERFYLNKAPANLFKIIEKAHQRGSLVGTAISDKGSLLNAQKRKKGLIEGHAYSVTKLNEVQLTGAKKVSILRIKNPWSNHTEWNGPFADKSAEWKLVPDHIKHTMKVNFQEDGEFYMPYNDFLKYFDRVEICHMTPDLLVGEEVLKWNLATYNGSWTPGGGNSQIIIKLEDPDDYDDDDNCTIVVALMQKNRRIMRAHDYNIMFDIYKMTAEDVKAGFLHKSFFERNNIVGSTTRPEAHREICARFRFLPGYYVIVPRISSTNEVVEFMVRIFTEAPHHSEHESLIVKVNKPTYNGDSASYTQLTQEVKIQLSKLQAIDLEQGSINQMQSENQPARQRQLSQATKGVKTFMCFLLLSFLLAVFVFFFLMHEVRSPYLKRF